VSTAQKYAGLCAEPRHGVGLRETTAFAQEPYVIAGSIASHEISCATVEQAAARVIALALADEITARLRPQFLTPFTERCPLDAMPDVARRYILCREDHIVNPEWSRRVAAERLGVEAVELPGSHSPMASRPDELANILLSGSRSALMAAG
jgi:hypothetical protein